LKNVRAQTISCPKTLFCAQKEKRPLSSEGTLFASVKNKREAITLKRYRKAPDQVQTKKVRDKIIWLYVTLFGSIEL
jgi:hypothetical protein